MSFEQCPICANDKWDNPITANDEELYVGCCHHEFGEYTVQYTLIRDVEGSVDEYMTDIKLTCNVDIDDEDDMNFVSRSKSLISFGNLVPMNDERIQKALLLQ